MVPTRPPGVFLHLLRKNEEELLAEVTQRGNSQGDRVFQRFFRDVSKREFPAATARAHWEGFLAHRKQLNHALGRRINLIAALSDYLEIATGKPFLPLPIDQNDYSCLFQESIHDKLTGLNNRAYFDEVFEQQISFAHRYRTDLTLLFLDIDNFKDINDRYGHQAGDAALKVTASIIAKVKRESDIAIRFGGEEFVLLMPNTGKNNGFSLGERIRTSLAVTTLTYNDATFSLTISGGLASYPIDGETTTDILSTADRALYQAKGAGKNIISLYREDKRRFLRVKFENPVFVKELGTEVTHSYEGQGIDICIGGILFTMKEPLVVGAKIQIHTQIDEERPLLLIGKVIRVEASGPEEYKIGASLSFGELEKVAKKEISELLRAELWPMPGSLDYASPSAINHRSEK